MTIDAALKFMQQTAVDESYRQDLSALIGVGDGNISSAKELDELEAEALKGERGVLLADYAAKHGFQFTVGDLATVVDAYQRIKSGELSESEFSKLLGLHDTTQVSSSLPAIGEALELGYRGLRYKAKPTTSNGHRMQAVRFMEKTASDEALRRELQTLLGVGDGDISGATELDSEEVRALKSERAALVAEFASKQGFQFSMADLIAVTNAFQRVQSGELSQQEFVKLLNLSDVSGSQLPLIGKVVELAFKGVRYRDVIPSTGQDSTLQVVRFLEKTAADNTLQEELQTLIGGDGNVSSPGELELEEALALKGELGSQVTQLAAKYGFNFTLADLSAVVGAFQFVHTGALSEESCVQVLGLSGSKYATPGILSSVKQTADLVYRGIPYKN